MDFYLQSDWQLAIGQFVEIRQDGRTLRTGVVEAVMSDNSILWISVDATHPREMIERADGKQVFIHTPGTPRQVQAFLLGQEFASADY